MSPVIRDLVITPIAFSDPPLLNSWGVHEPLALRIIIELITEDGAVGLGECQGGVKRLQQLELVKPALIGLSIFSTSLIEQRIEAVLGSQGDVDRGATARLGGGTGGQVGAPTKASRGVFSPIEVACLDAQGHTLGLGVVDLLGGRVRAAVPYSAYLFYKWAEHPADGDRGAIGDRWGPALDPQGLVDQAAKMIKEYGFAAIKLKAGVFPPEQEIAAIKALAEAFPGVPLRIDPNGCWTEETSIAVGAALVEELEYLEDPILGRGPMGAVARAVGMPLATNMCVIDFADIPEALELGSIGVVLSDHHVWGGLRHSLELAAICRTVGWGLSMHSNSHLGISLAAMTHLGAAMPNLDYACDTHYPWNFTEDVIVPGPIRFIDGSMPVPEGPGLGVELDHDRLAKQHEVFVASGRQERDDTAYLRRVDPTYDPTQPRF